MICISIAQESRRFALVDMFNAGPQADLLEVRLDRFDKAANVGELLEHKPKPVIMTCRRGEDGGDWQGNEEERLALLRQCIISKADYVEIELDAADQIRPLPPAKRVISYTNLLEVPDNLQEIYGEALRKSPDVIKVVVPAHTPEQIWPVVQLLAKPPVPTVVVGLGKPGVMLALLARKIGAPWVYAALERGMEAYHEQPTIHDLQTVYHYGAIHKSTPFVGVAGFGELQYVTVALLNAAFASLGQAVRCLPVEIGNVHTFRKVLEAVKAGCAFIDADHQAAIREVVAELKPSAQTAEAVDFIAHQEGKWQGHHLFCRAVVAALEETVRAKTPKEKPLQGRMVMLVGINGISHALAVRVQQGGGIPILASTDAYEGQRLAGALGCRFVLRDALYTTLHDVLIVCEETEVHPGYLKPGMSVVDLTTLPRPSALLNEAERRGCLVVAPAQVLVELVARLARAIAGQEVAREHLVETLEPLLEN
jgi:3-dehydroquinate dehydratase/shikimate dehydrogenase